MLTNKYHINALTSYDLLKSLAVLLMVLDHIGYFFYPENEWFRVVGRASMPIWFFLVGFARSRDLSRPLWIGAVAVFASNIILGGEIFPLNILFTIIFIRLILDRVATITFRNWEVMTYASFLIGVLSLMTFFFTEYGTLALLIAMAGYLLRNGHSFDLTETAKRIFMGYAVGLYAVSQLLIFHNMTKIEAQVMVVAIGAVSLLLYFFKPKEVPEVEERLPPFLVSALQFGGRYTLEIYVVHLILIKLIACLYGLKGYGWFQWDWIRM